MNIIFTFSVIANIRTASNELNFMLAGTQLLLTEGRLQNFDSLIPTIELQDCGISEHGTTKTLSFLLLAHLGSALLHYYILWPY